jgi:hypothetical protein
MARTPTFIETQVKKRRLVYIDDWLPPDFGAVGQYAMLSTRKWVHPQLRGAGRRWSRVVLAGAVKPAREAHAL